MKFTTSAFSFAFFVYIMISVLTLLIFGSGVHNDVLINISDSNFQFKYLLLVLYLVISAMHMPMVFFAGKEAVLNIYIHLTHGNLTEKETNIKDAEYSGSDSNMYYVITTVIYVCVF